MSSKDCNSCQEEERGSGGVALPHPNRPQSLSTFPFNFCPWEQALGPCSHPKDASEAAYSPLSSADDETQLRMELNPVSCPMRSWGALATRL